MKHTPRTRCVIAPHAALLAFTLVELLTVIAIIGILAAIIIPVAGNVRNKARGMQCLSNLRQIQVANILYAADNKDTYVPIRDDTHEAEYGSRWWRSNPHFLAILSPRPTMVEQLKCPLGKALYDSTSNKHSTAYGYNSTSLSPGGITGLWQVKVSDVQRPSRTIAFVDALDQHVKYANSNDYTGEEVATNQTTSYRHGAAANVVYWDGHAALVKRDQLAKDAADLNKPQWMTVE
ncbi:hypothetical protein OPIT5_15490 [Opitutaceae bacterium TAV5]|nr:hypothetical protein OPIT5_15490 [Opitutaceae bacterium TAV5]